MSKARPVNESMPFMVPLASMSRRTVSKLAEQVLAVVHAVGGRRRWRSRRFCDAGAARA